TSLKVGAVVAKSFARIFYRNAINQGLPVIQSPKAVEAIEAGETIEIDFEKGTIKTDSGKEFTFAPIPEYVRGILKDGGLVEHVKKSLGLE
ncbi:MAG TPA: 3-isopropylmalate dehydratase, partial [Synergistales bacterium]|nr:3-isopropylmalate dehydratase [Synergistales bacterium]